MKSSDAKDIVIAVGLLSGTGVLMVYSSTSVMSMQSTGSATAYFWKHLFTVCVGAAVMFAMSMSDYKKARSHNYSLIAVSSLLLLLVFVPGIGSSANGAQRWIRIWPTSLTFQPSELIKLVAVISLANYMDKHIHRMKDYRYGICIPFGIVAGFQAIIIIQPDFGAVMSLAILTTGLLIIGGVRLKHLGVLVLFLIASAYVLIKYAPYRLKRFTCFLDPWEEPLGCGYQLIQSLIAIHNGKVLGRGLGNSKQKLGFLPEAHNDFIFSIIGEELGLLVSMCVVGIFVWLFMKGMKVSSRTEDPYSYYLAVGLSMMIGVQSVVNFGVAMGLLPTKGLPLPFISYGGSALVINMAAAGILINIARQNETRNRFPAGPQYNRAGWR
ncbi:MAG: putative lipid II flippase FtsW [Nitrospirota bacterium]